MSVTKYASTGPDSSYIYEIWMAYNVSDLNTAFASLRITRPTPKHDVFMSEPTYVDNIKKLHAVFVSYKNLPPKKIGK